MPRPNRRDAVELQVLNLLAANPQGLSSPRLRARLKPRLSQPTLSRLLLNLRARGKVVKSGSARATRYHLVDGRIAAAELRSRLLHEQVADKLVRHPALNQQAIDRLQVLRKVNPHGRRYHERWAELLDSDMPRLLRAMTEDSEQAAALRRESPFTILMQQEWRGKLMQPSHTPAQTGARPLARLGVSRARLGAFCRRHDIKRLAFFGSVTRDDFRPDSDVDVLVDFMPGRSPDLGGVVELREDLSSLFGGRAVDLITRRALRNPFRSKSIQKDLETVYGD